MDRRQFLKSSAIAAAAFGIGGCEAQQVASPAARTVSAQTDSLPNILIVVLDTVRQDHLSCYGYNRETSPFLDSLMPEVRQYTNAYSPANWTVPSHASLFTGLHPTSHGCRWGNLWVAENLVTLPEILKTKGYRTIGLAENTAIRPERGYTQGWDLLENPSKRNTEAVSHVVARLREVIEPASSDPTFIFLNFLAAHKPYKWSGDFRNHYLSDPEYADFVVHPDVTSKEPPHLDPKPLRHLIEHYDASVRYVDEQIKMVVDEMQTQGLWDNTLAFFVSDHGESLGEHNHFGHQFYLYDDLTRIPFLMRWPGSIAGGESREGAVSLVDIVPTVLEALNVDASAAPVQGVSLLSNETGYDRPIVMENYLHELFRENSTRGREFSEKTTKRFEPEYVRERFARAYKSLAAGDSKLIRGSDGRIELYDLGQDPGETVNLAMEPDHAEELAEREAQLDALLAEFRADRDGDPDTQELSESTIEDLEALGYL